MTAGGGTGPLGELRGGGAAYGRTEGPHGGDRSPRPGQVAAVPGPKGAGKHTRLKVPAGPHPPGGGAL